jgi:HlyD family secretion protein
MTGMDHQRFDKVRSRKIRRVVYGVVAVLLTGGVTIGVSRLRPAAPVVSRAGVLTDEVKRGSMLREVRGWGTLVPEEIQWIPAQSDSRIDQILLQPGAAVQPASVILELTDPGLRRDTLDAEYQLKAAEADYLNLKVQLDNELLNQKASAASVRSEYEQAKIQNEVDARLQSEGLGAEVTEKLSKVKAEQLGIRLQLEEDRTKNLAESSRTRLLAQQSHVEQQRALYDLRRSEMEALHVRAGIAGILQAVPVEVGQRVSPGTNLARVANPKKLKAEIKIAETQAKDVMIGQKASIDTRNGLVAGQVSRIDPSVQNGTVTVDIQITESLPLGARPDLNVDGTIEIENLKDILFVGHPAHGQSDSTVGLFKLVDDGDAVKVNVKLGRSAVNTIEVLQGLKEGDKVIISDMSNWDRVERLTLR